MATITDLIQSLLQELKDKRISMEEEPIVIGRLGRKLEHLFLGYTLPDEVNLFFRPEEYLSFHRSLEEVKRIQPVGYDPLNPSGGCNKEFFEAVKLQMDFFLGDYPLEYFIAVGTKFDYWHGVDSVFCWNGFTVTIDVTVYPEKEYKSDFLITAKDVESGEVYTTFPQKITLLFLQKFLGSQYQDYKPIIDPTGKRKEG